jgi:hypothetical protein
MGVPAWTNPADSPSPNKAQTGRDFPKLEQTFHYFHASTFIHRPIVDWTDWQLRQ